LLHFCSLLGLDFDVLRKTLTTREITSGGGGRGETIIKKQTSTECTYGRDALSKLLYSELFNWAVTTVNSVLEKKNETTPTTTNNPKKPLPKFIGVLDIYGFETFEINSFEQFCINYANEKLQQQFNLVSLLTQL
jgi:myosin-5